MVSRANLSMRPGASGVLKRVMNPRQRRTPKIQPTVPGDSDTPESIEQSGGGLSGMLGRALAAGRERQQQAAERNVKPQPGPESPVPRGPLARAKEMAGRKRAMDMRGRAGRQRSGLEQMGATQGEIAAGPGGVVRRAQATAGRDIGRGREVLEREAQAARTQDALAATGETGGTRSEVDVTEPTLNQARQRRSRSGRILR